MKVINGEILQFETEEKSESVDGGDRSKKNISEIELKEEPPMILGVATGQEERHCTDMTAVANVA